MSTQLTIDQRNDLQRHGNSPMPLIDPVTQQVYMLMSGDVYERVKALFEDQSFDLSETCTAQSLAAGAGGWDDPEMDVYDSYDAPKPRP